MPDYIVEPLDTDAGVIFQRFVDWVNNYYPEWDPSEGQLDVIIARFFAMQIGFTADMASMVQRAIYRYLGASLCNIPPLPGSAATATIRFYCQDSDRTGILPYGSGVGMISPSGERFVFMTLADMVVAPHDLTGSIEVQAQELGADGNGLTGAVELVEMVDWIDSAEVDGVSSGGSDPEEDSVYIQRLTTNFALMAPRPVIANDFAEIAKNIPGVWRAAAIDSFAPGLNEKQSVSHNYTGGNATLSFDGGGPSATVPWNGTAAQVKAALEGLTAVNVGDVICTGGPWPAAIIVEFTGQYQMVNVPAITLATTALTGGTTVTITTTVVATTWTATAANTVAISAVDQSGEAISGTIRDNLLTYLESLRQQNFIIIYCQPSYNIVAVNYAGVCIPSALASSIQTNVNTALEQYLTPVTWGVPQWQRLDGLGRTWEVPDNPATNKMRYLDLTTVVENVPGYDYTTALTFSVGGGTVDATDKLLQGPFPLVRMGAIGGAGVSQG